LLDESESGEEEVAVHFDDLHGLNEVVLPDDLLDPDLGPFILASADVVGDFLARLLRQLGFLLLEQLESVDGQPQVRLQLHVVRPARKHVGPTLFTRSTDSKRLKIGDE